MAAAPLWNLKDSYPGYIHFIELHNLISNKALEMSMKNAQDT